MGADLPASGHPLNTPAPLQLGTDRGSPPALIASIDGDLLNIDTHAGRVGISKRGAGHLGRYLLAWSRPKAEMKLWGVGGIISECKVSRATAYKWINREDFPEPLDIVGGNGQVWEADAVKAWVEQTPRRAGRPRKQKGRASRS